MGQEGPPAGKQQGEGWAQGKAKPPAPRLPPPRPRPRRLQTRPEPHGHRVASPCPPAPSRPGSPSPGGFPGYRGSGEPASCGKQVFGSWPLRDSKQGAVPQGPGVWSSHWGPPWHLSAPGGSLERWWAPTLTIHGASGFLGGRVCGLQPWWAQPLQPQPGGAVRRGLPLGLVRGGSPELAGDPSSRQPNQISP